MGMLRDWEVVEQLGGSRVEARLGKVTEELGSDLERLSA